MDESVRVIRVIRVELRVAGAFVLPKLGGSNVGLACVDANVRMLGADIATRERAFAEARRYGVDPRADTRRFGELRRETRALLVGAGGVRCEHVRSAGRRRSRLAVFNPGRSTSAIPSSQREIASAK